MNDFIGSYELKCQGKKKVKLFFFPTFVVVKMSGLIKILIISVEESVPQLFYHLDLKLLPIS